MKPALVTDSNSQIPESLRKQFDVRVVPIPVVIDDIDYLEGVDLDADGFYALFDDGTPDVSTSQPSPGAFIEAYESCVAAGHDEIISIHVTKAMSGTLNSARIAAEMVEVPVHLVDSGTASFGITCCVWQAGLVLEAGASAGEAIEVAEKLAGNLFSVTALGAADLLKASGRIDFEASDTGVDVFRAGPGGGFDVVGSGSTADQVCDLMAATMHSDGSLIRVALGIADSSAHPYAAGLEARLTDRADVVEIVHYRIGPSVGAFTGPGTAGGFWYPA